jgi:hypothetical protein
MPNWRIPLALAAVTALSACGGDAPDRGATLNEDFAVIARDVIHDRDNIHPDDVAQWIIEGRKDFVLYDVRTQEAFDAGHIDGAESRPMTFLVEKRSIADIPRDRKVILYSNATDHAAQAAVMLRLAGVDAYSLLGGYNLWQERILNPDLSKVADAEKHTVEKRRAIACYFAGNYRGGEAMPAPEEEPEEETASAPFVPDTVPADEAPEEPMGLVIGEGC